MGIKRRPFQGVLNIIRFNWHFYLAAGMIVILLLVFRQNLPDDAQAPILWLAILGLILVMISLIVSYYIYDFSDLYRLPWTPDLNNKKVLNVNAGFDETSDILKSTYPGIELTVCDFYDVEKHTEWSIKRARKLYPPSENTAAVRTEALPFDDDAFDCVMAILSAHEIRVVEERTLFFHEICRVLKDSGQVYVVEHLRDLPNVLAYGVGSLHFHNKVSWLRTFERANLWVKQELKTTPFVTTFTLEKHGESH